MEIRRNFKIFINSLNIINLSHVKHFLKNYFLKQSKILWAEWHCLTFLQISLMSDRLEDSWICVSALNSIWSDIRHFVSLWKTSLSTHKRMKMKKEKNVLVIFLETSSFLQSPLLLPQKSHIQFSYILFSSSTKINVSPNRFN